MRKHISKSLVLSSITFLCLTLVACGGGGSSSDAGSSIISDTSDPTTSPQNNSPTPPKKTPNDSNNSNPRNTFANKIEINPLRDLGLGKGKNICFKLKSYNNVSESDFSKSICGKIKDNHLITLTWEDAIGNIVGYYVYFGTNKNNVKNYLADVLS